MWINAQTSDSLAVLEAAVEIAPKDGEAWVRLGNLYLDQGEMKKADKAFRKGIRYAKSAEAYIGLGRVFMAKGPTMARGGLKYFRMARAKDPESIEPDLYLARAKVMLRDLDAEDAFRDVIEKDPEYTPVYLELAEWYLNHNLEMYYEEIRPLYETYLELRPDDVDALYGLALTYTEQRNYRPVVEIGESALAKFPDEARVVALVAQAYAALGDPDLSLEMFGKFMGMISDEERALYEDLRLVASPEELDIFEGLAGEDRAELLGKFWRKRDLTLISGGLAREAEHYRRVWYARAHFAKDVQPWDRRGEVYIRYGEPDYRSRSNAPNPLPSAEVETVKERLALDIGLGDFVGLGDIEEESFFGGPDDEQAVGDFEGVDLVEPIYPVAFDERSVPWESWIYTQVGGGVEFVFVDELLNGEWRRSAPPGSASATKRLLSSGRLPHPRVCWPDGGLRRFPVAMVVNSASGRWSLRPLERAAGGDHLSSSSTIATDFQATVRAIWGSYWLNAGESLRKSLRTQRKGRRLGMRPRSTRSLWTCVRRSSLCGSLGLALPEKTSVRLCCAGTLMKRSPRSPRGWSGSSQRGRSSGRRRKWNLRTPTRRGRWSRQRRRSRTSGSSKRRKGRSPVRWKND